MVAQASSSPTMGPHCAHRNLSVSTKSKTIRKNTSLERVEAAIVDAARKTCAICLEDNINKGKAAVIEDCMHVFCIPCIQKWSELKQTCPICKSKFDSWFYTSQLEGLRRHAIPKREHVMEVINLGDIWPSILAYFKRETTRPKPIRPVHNQRKITISPEVLREAGLQMRRRVYDQNLQAVPYLSSEFEYRVEDFIIIGKDKILKKIMPWILRELEVITGIPDPLVIVHVATTVYFEELGKWNPNELLSSIAEVVEEDDSFLDPLRRFLYEKTNLFWHELKCFSQSYLPMEKYDKLVQYPASASASASHH